MTSTAETTVLREQAWLLQNQLNPFPMAGELLLDAGQLSFTLSNLAADASLGWLERRLGTADLKARIEAGEPVVAFSQPVEAISVRWPLSLGKIGMKIKAPDRTWIVALDYPSGGAIWQIFNLINGRKKAAAWRQALKAATA